MPTPKALTEAIAADEMTGGMGASPMAMHACAASGLSVASMLASAPTKLRKTAGHATAEEIFKTVSVVPPSSLRPKVWTMAEWLEKEGVAQVLANILIGDKVKPPGDVDVAAEKTDELWAVRELVSEHSGHLEKELRKRVQESIRAIGDFLVPKLRALDATAEQQARRAHRARTHRTGGGTRGPWRGPCQEPRAPCVAPSSSVWSARRVRRRSTSRRRSTG